MACAPETLWAALAAYGERAALRDAAGEWSGARVLAEVAARRAVLDGLGAQRVALALDNGADWVAWDLALLASGRVCVPVPGFFSPQQQAQKRYWSATMRSCSRSTRVGRSRCSQARLTMRRS